MHLIRKILAVVLLTALILVVGAGNIIAFLQQKGTETVDEVKKLVVAEVEPSDTEEEDYSQEEQVYETKLEGFSVGGNMSETGDSENDTESDAESDKNTKKDKKNDKKKDSSESDSETDGFIFSNSDSEYLTKKQLKKLTKEEETIARNELYARRGYIFSKNQEMKEYFESQSWYVGEFEDQAEVDAMFNDYERANKELFIEYEKEKGWR